MPPPISWMVMVAARGEVTVVSMGSVAVGSLPVVTWPSAGTVSDTVSANTQVMVPSVKTVLVLGVGLPPRSVMDVGGLWIAKEPLATALSQVNVA